MKHKTIRSRMIFGYVTLFLVIIVLMSVGTYILTCRLLAQVNQRSYEKILNSAEEVLNDRLDIYEANMRMILADDAIQAVLMQDDRNENAVFMDTSRTNALQSVGRSYTNEISDICGLYLFDNEGRLFYSDPDRSSNEVSEAFSYENIEQSDWYGKALGAKGREVFFGYDVLWDSENQMSCVKTINEIGSNQKIGFLVLNVRREIMRNVLGQLPIQNDIYIITQDGRITWQNGFPEQDSDGRSLEEVLGNEDGEYEITDHACGLDGWHLIHAVKSEYLFREAGLIRLVIIIIGIIAIILMVIMSIIEAYNISKPLRQLSEDIKSVGEGKRLLPSKYEDDEVGRIGRQFQQMVKEQIELKEKYAEAELLRKDSELQLLQSQINPHFLYNTLDTLYWMAMSRDAEDVADLTQSLSEIFKISLSQGEEFITVRDEVKFIEDYLHIQDIRFEGKFLFRIQVEQDMLSRKITKQIIQPFVENAIYHGLEPKIGKGGLSIEGRQEDGFLCFIVTDDGVGIPPNVDVMKGYAVSNVIQRIKLHYGDGADVLFDSEEGKGTVVTILLPEGEVRRVEDRIG